MAINVVVCVKQIPDPSAPARLDPASKRLVREGVDLVLDPGDEHAVEAALQVAEGAGGEVTVVSMGPARAVDAIRRALSMGGARGIHVQDPALQNSDALRPARVLESTDGSTGAVPGQLAELLGLPLLSFARKLSVEEGKASIHRQTDEGYDVVEAPLPAVVTVTGGINDPRYPSLRGIMQSKNKEVRQLTLEAIGLIGKAGEKALTQEVVDLQPAQARKAGRVIEDKGEGAREIVDFLAELKVI